MHKIYAFNNFTNKTIYPCIETVNEYIKGKSKLPISDIKSINERTNQLYTVLNDHKNQFKSKILPIF